MLLKTVKKLIFAILGIAIILVLLMSFNLIATRIATQKYNMIDLDGNISVKKSNEQFEKKFIELSDITMCYYTMGNGYPLVLVHGNGGNHTGLIDVAEYLANDYTVYLVESRCHGESSETDVINYDLMAKDLQEFIVALGLDKPIMIGHSDGGINALVTAINYPDLLGGLVSFGANTNPKEFKWYFTALVTINNIFNKSILNDMMLTEPNITETQLKSIKVPSYIIAGEFDIVKLKDTLRIANNIPNSEYTIVKGGDHSDYVHNGTKCYQLIAPFIANVIGAK